MRAYLRPEPSLALFILSRSLRARFHTLLFMGLLAGCTEPQSTGQTFGDERWTVEGPSVRIGSVDDPEYAFRAVTALAMSPTGVLHSLHRGEATIRRWDAQGEPAGTIGREGEGPGEFDTPSGLGFFGDSLWVMDRRAYRVSYFDLNGQFLGSVSPRLDMTPDPDNPHESAPRPSLPLRDGLLYGIAPAWSDAIARGQISEVDHVLMGPEGGNLGTIWAQPYTPTDVLALLREDGGTFGRQPFGDQPLFQVSSDGGLWVLDRRVFGGDGEPSFKLTKIAMNGDTLIRKEIEYAPEALSEEEIDSAVQEMAEGMLGFMQRRDAGLEPAKLERDLRAATYAPDYLPPVSSMLIAEDGSIWIERFSPSEEGILWWVLGGDAEPRATAVTPPGLRVLLITDDAIWGVETDEFDVNYIVRYDLVRG